MIKKTECFIEMPEGKIFYCKYAGKNKGLPLVVVHGGPGYSHDTLEIISPLAEEMTVIFYDQLGCGRSDRPDNEKLWVIQRYVDELSTVINHFGLKEHHILGHSFGGSIAVEYGLRKPDGLRSLILSSPLISVKDWLHDTNIRKQELPENVQRVIAKHEADGTLEDPEYLKAIRSFNNNFLCRLDPKPPVYLKAFEDFNLKLYRHMWGPSEFHCIGNLASFERADSLKKLAMPVLLMCGDNDEIREETMRTYLSKLSFGELEVLKNCAHSSYLEDPEKYIEAVANFLNKVEA